MGEAREHNEDAQARGRSSDTTGGEAAEALSFLRFELLRSALYHDMRQTALSRTHKILMFLTVLLGSGAVLALGGTVPYLGQAAGLVIAVISAAQLVWDFGGAAGRHGELRRSFYALLSDLEAGSDPTQVPGQMTLLYKDEPPIVHRVNKRAHDRAGDTIYGPGNFERA